MSTVLNFAKAFPILFLSPPLPHPQSRFPSPGILHSSFQKTQPGPGSQERTEVPALLESPFPAFRDWPASLPPSAPNARYFSTIDPPNLGEQWLLAIVAACLLSLTDQLTPVVRVSSCQGNKQAAPPPCSVGSPACFALQTLGGGREMLHFPEAPLWGSPLK